MKKIIKHELVEVQIPAGTTLTRFMFPDIANLRNTKILGLQIYENAQVPFSILSQKAVSTPAINNLAYVSFANYGGKYFLNKAKTIRKKELNARGQSYQFCLEKLK